MENGNKPAMPIVGIAFDENHKGLTKREYFAAMAMQGILAGGGDKMKIGSPQEQRNVAMVTSVHSVAIANAVLAELDKTK